MAFKAQQVEEWMRKYYYLNTYICGIASFAYFAMFSGMGWETIMGCRQFFYVRFIEWAVTTPMIILSLGLLANEDPVVIAAVMGSDVAMIVAGYLGSVALVPTVKWLWFIIGLVVFAPVVYALVRVFRQTVIQKDDVDRIDLYGKVSLLVVVTWSLYPLVWILGVGTGVLGISAESICYAVLDVITKCVFAFMMVNVSGYESAEIETQREFV
jgi:bacteriorhodopsin